MACCPAVVCVGILVMGCYGSKPSVVLWILTAVIVLMLVAMTDIVTRITYVITGNTLTV